MTLNFPRQLRGNDVIIIRVPQVYIREQFVLQQRTLGGSDIYLLCEKLENLLGKPLDSNLSQQVLI